MDGTECGSCEAGKCLGCFGTGIFTDYYYDGRPMDPSAERWRRLLAPGIVLLVLGVLMTLAFARDPAPVRGQELEFLLALLFGFVTGTWATMRGLRRREQWKAFLARPHDPNDPYEREVEAELGRP